VQEPEFMMRKKPNLCQVHSNTNKKLIRFKDQQPDFHLEMKNKDHKLQNPQ